MSETTLEINCDLGEGFGRWSFAPDEEFMPYISTANIACGFHAGDPRIMRETVKKAIAHGLQIGAHVALPDLLGFGRRRMNVSPEELRDYTVYQIGALKGFVDAEGGRLSHVKPHGVMYVMAHEDVALAESVIQAVAEVDRDLLLYVLDDRNAALAAAHGVTLVPEGFADLHYDNELNLLIERQKVAWDPEDVAARAIRLVRDGVIIAKDGTVIPLERKTLCLHGDAPNSVEVIRTVHTRLTENGIRVKSLVDAR